MKRYMGQVMAECDCTHPACDQRGYCMADRIEELELAVRYEADLAQQALDARKELEGKLAKAIAIVDERHVIHMTGKGRNPTDYISMWSVVADEIRELAELKGQDDE